MLNTLSLSFIRIPDDKFLIETFGRITEHWEYLTALKLDAICNYPSSAKLSIIPICNFKNLESLDLCGQMINDDLLIAVGGSCKELSRVVLNCKFHFYHD